jgi:N-acetylglucosaminyldiphosphoundecaprenol N-acetyl-beta-D-mannosaminyltransferase
MNISDDRDRLFGLPYTRIKYYDAVKVILRASSESFRKYIFTPNVQHFYNYKNNPAFRKAYESAFYSLLDGMPLVWASRLASGLPTYRVPGSDIFIDLFKSAMREGLRVYILGSMPGVAEKAIAKLGYFDKIGIQAFFSSPVINIPIDDLSNAKICEEINRVQPNILFVALSCPKQELWIAENIGLLNVNISIGIGGSVDFVAGVQKRAPNWMQKVGLEWFFRLSCDPRRLFYRYFVTNSFFLPFFALACLKLFSRKINLPNPISL